MTVNVLEIRNYTLQAGKREHFIDYFDANYIPTLEAANMRILGQFRLMGEPDHYVWLRGYSDMQARLQALEAFYNSEYWLKRRALTNSMMIDSDNVHLLRLVSGDLTRGLNAQTVAMEFAAGTVSPETGMVAIDMYVAQTGKRDALLETLQKQVVPAYEHEGIDLRALCVSEMSENTFPRHPVIQIADLVVVFTVYESDEACKEQRSRVARHVAENTSALVRGVPQTLLLSPTLRSPMRFTPR